MLSAPTTQATSLAIVAALLSAGCGGPSISARVHGTVEVSGSETYRGAAVFEVPANLAPDCATLARRGLYEEQRRLQLLFAPQEMTQDTPLQQLTVSIANYSGPGMYSIDASTFRFVIRSRVLSSIDPGAALIIGADGNGSIRASGRFEGGGDVRLALAFTCTAS